ncbi:amidase [Sphaerisporangium rhizosphaerae]|uniref:Amidase n=1 Tax=Sphaerisporangium rhizosphaerae TaxID=2269375 RepID=A0ABW2P8K4_9ACTN
MRRSEISAPSQAQGDADRPAHDHSGDALPAGPFAGRDISGLGRDLREGRVTAEGLVRLTLDAVAEINPAVNAFVHVDPAGALAAARRADAELAEGIDRGPLHGLPVAVKDIIMVAGLPVTMGSRHFTGHVPDEDARCVAHLRRAGAVIIGTTVTHQFAYGPTGDRSASGPARNPHDRRRMTGGSSGGSAAAVAAGIVPLAVGTDTGGSVRIPAALCGVAGFKPAYGTIPADGVFPLSRTLDHVGLLAATPRDCLIAYRTLTADVTPNAGPPTGDTRNAAHLASAHPAAARPRAAWLDPDGLFSCDPRVAATVRAFVESATGPLEEVSLAPDVVRDLGEAYVAIQSSETAAVHATRLAQAPDLFDAEVLERLRGATEMPGWRYVLAMEARPRLAEAVGALFARHEVLALPTVPITAPPIGTREVELHGAPAAVRAALLSYTSMWNVLGLPALSIPAGTLDGLPVALHLITRPLQEDSLFSLLEDPHEFHQALDLT